MQLFGGKCLGFMDKHVDTIHSVQTHISFPPDRRHVASTYPHSSHTSPPFCVKTNMGLLSREDSKSSVEVAVDGVGRRLSGSSRV